MHDDLLYVFGRITSGAGRGLPLPGLGVAYIQRYLVERSSMQRATSAITTNAALFIYACLAT